MNTNKLITTLSLLGLAACGTGTRGVDGQISLAALGQSSAAVVATDAEGRQISAPVGKDGRFHIELERGRAYALGFRTNEAESGRRRHIAQVVARGSGRTQNALFVEDSAGSIQLGALVRSDDPAAHDAGDDNGVDDPATHDVGDDNGVDDPATHDVGDDHGVDDPATHDVGDDHGRSCRSQSPAASASTSFLVVPASDDLPFTEGEHEGGSLADDDHDGRSNGLDDDADDDGICDERGDDNGVDDPATHDVGDDNGVDAPGTDDNGVDAPGTDDNGVDAPGTDDNGMDAPGTDDNGGGNSGGGNGGGSNSGGGGADDPSGHR